MSESVSGEYDFSAFKRKAFQILELEGVVKNSKLCGYSKNMIRRMVENPIYNHKNILKLSNHVYLKSGYMRSFIDYKANMAMCNWTVNLEIKDASALDESKNDLIQRKYIGFIDNINKFHLEYEFNEIFKRMFVEDVCCGFIVGDFETGEDFYIHYLDPSVCEIKYIANGVYNYVVRTAAISNSNINNYPLDLQLIISDAKEAGEEFAFVPFEKQICLKYFDTFPYIFPPMFHLILDILDIDEYKEIQKAKTETEAYRLLVMDLPKTEDNTNVAMKETITLPVFEMAKQIVPRNIGILPSPMDINAIQFKSDQAERDRVDDSTAQLYKESGISQSIAAGGSTGSEVKLSMGVDYTDIFRLYRNIERWLNLLMKVCNKNNNKSFSFKYELLDIVKHNQTDYIKNEMTLSAASVPNKMRLCAANGINPATLLGNQRLENDILNIGESWTPLQTSYTQTSDTQTTGKPAVEETELTKSGQKAKDNDSNDPDNRL